MGARARPVAEIRKEVLKGIVKTSPRDLNVKEIEAGKPLYYYGIRAQKHLRENLANEFPEIDSYGLAFTPSTRVRTLVRRVERSHRRLVAAGGFVRFTCGHCLPASFGLCFRDGRGRPTRRLCIPD